MIQAMKESPHGLLACIHEEYQRQKQARGDTIVPNTVLPERFPAGVLEAPTLATTAAVLGQSFLVVTPDTAIAHLAYRLKSKPLVLQFYLQNSGDARRWTPPGNSVVDVVVSGSDSDFDSSTLLNRAQWLAEMGNAPFEEIFSDVPVARDLLAGIVDLSGMMLDPSCRDQRELLMLVTHMSALLDELAPLIKAAEFQREMEMRNDVFALLGEYLYQGVYTHFLRHAAAFSSI